MRLKPDGLRYLDISGNFNAVLRFCYVVLCCVFIPLFLCGFAVFVPPYQPYAPLSLDFCLI